MGNSINPHQKSQSTGKVILWDGSVQEFEKSLTVAELMLEHPQQAVVEFQSAVTGKRPTPLPADMKLEAKKIYMMLPIKRGKTAALSSNEIRRVLLIANSVLRSRSVLGSTKFLPLFARICPAVTVADNRHEVLEPKKEWIEQTTDEKTTSFVGVKSVDPPESLDSGPEYLSRQFSGRGWKPSLDTIEEKTMVQRKVSHWLF